MARTKKTVETRIQEMEAERAKYQARIEKIRTKMAALDGKIENLENRRQKKEVERLMKAIRAAGKTPDDVMSDIQRYQNVG